MKRRLSVSAFCTAVLFCASAIPSPAGMIDFSNDGTSATGSDISLFSPSIIPSTTPNDDTVIGILTDFNMYNFGSGNVSGFFVESYCTTTTECMDLGISGSPAINTIYVTGTIPALNNLTGSIGGTGNSAPLIAIQLSGSLTGTSSLTSPYFTGYVLPTVSSIVVNPLLLSDLSLPGAMFTLDTADVNIGGSAGNYTVTQSAALDLTTVSGTPEPASWLLMTLGISLMVFFFARRKSSRVGQ